MGPARGTVSSRGGSGRSTMGDATGSREVGVPAPPPKPKARASFAGGAVTGVNVRTGVGKLFTSRGGCGGGCAGEKPNCRGSLRSTGALGILKPIDLGSVGRGRVTSVVTVVAFATETGFRPDAITVRGDTG